MRETLNSTKMSHRQFTILKTRIGHNLS